MRTIRSLLALCCLMMSLVVGHAAWADALPAVGEQHLAMRLVAESSRPRSGSTVTLALDTRPQPGWHGYWQNPGDAGFPATLAWRLPKGVSARAPAYPVPTTLLIAGLMNYVYERPYAPLVELRVPAGLAAGTPLPVRLHASYLVCTASLCVPEVADLSLDLVVGDGAPDRRAAFDAWRQAIPKPLGAAATWQVGKSADGKPTARIAIPYPAAASLPDAYFFPVTASALDYAAPQTVTRDGDRLLIATGATATAKGAIDGVLRTSARRGLAIHAVPGIVAVPGVVAAGATQAAAHGLGDALAAFALAVLGGLILNVMPCVFPILSLKALSLARSGTSAAHARAEALAYTAGVVLVCVGLGAVILGLRAGGATAGWAFQLQDPRTVAVLALLSAGIAFNLAGLFELPTPAVGNMAGRGGAFATGALAAIIATPCTGPFMGAALGAALVLPWFAALAVFAGLGLGLALPFIAIGFVPALRVLLPRPGAWMETARHVLSVPMFLTAIALGWVLGKEAGVDAFAFALVLALLLALVLWSVGGRQRQGGAIGLRLALGSAVIVALATFALPRSAPRAAVASATEQPFSEAKLAALRAANKPVFAYFTADWCLTCKVNERGAIADAGVRRAFDQHGVVTLVGDWTNGDAALGRFIQAHNRAGVPLYLYYAPGVAEPRVLPQVLTPATLEALAA